MIRMRVRRRGRLGLVEKNDIGHRGFYNDDDKVRDAEEGICTGPMEDAFMVRWKQKQQKQGSLQTNTASIGGFQAEYTFDNKNDAVNMCKVMMHSMGAYYIWDTHNEAQRTEEAKVAKEDEGGR